MQMAPPLMSHLSCWRRSPVDRRQLSTCRPTKKSQNTGRHTRPATVPTVNSFPAAPEGLALLIRWPVSSTVIGPRLRFHTVGPTKHASSSAATPR